MAQDRGAGIPDVEQAMEEGYCTAGSLGLGLPGVRRIVDELQITSQAGRGTTIVATKWWQMRAA